MTRLGGSCQRAVWSSWHLLPLGQCQVQMSSPCRGWFQALPRASGAVSGLLSQRQKDGSTSSSTLCFLSLALQHRWGPTWCAWPHFTDRQSKAHGGKSGCSRGVPWDSWERLDQCFLSALEPRACSAPLTQPQPHPVPMGGQALCGNGSSAGCTGCREGP